MLKSLFHIFFSLLLVFSFACNREKVNLEGRWQVAEISSPKGNNAPKDSVGQLLPHLSVGNILNFAGGELTVHRKGSPEDVYYGLGNYKVADDGREVRIDAGYYKPLKFKLRHSEDDQVEMAYEREAVKVLLREPEED